MFSCLALLFSTTVSAQLKIVTPENFGPNTLPIPELKTGKIAFENYSSDGDDTQNAFIELIIPVVSKKTALVLNVVLYEKYSLTPENVAFRDIVSCTAQGNASEDIYLGLHIQRVKDKNKLPDILDIKTASGSKSESARFTDTPGYIFDLSAGKDLAVTSKLLTSIRPLAMAGIYVYQTNRTIFRQNDPFLYGLGVDLNFNKLKFTTAYGGHHGYIENGDRSNVWRSTIRTQFSSTIKYKLRFGKGFDSNFYDAIRLGINVNIDFIKKLF